MNQPALLGTQIATMDEQWVSGARLGWGVAMIGVIAVGCAGGGVPETPTPAVASLGVDDGDESSGDDEEPSDPTGGSSGSSESSEEPTTTGPLPGEDTTAGEPEQTTTDSGCIDCVESCLDGEDDDGDGDADCDDADCSEHLACRGCTPATDLVHGTHVLCPDPVTWLEARDACEASGMHLVSIDGAAHNQWLVVRSQPLSAVSWWMGFSDLDVEGTWAWEDGTPVTYVNWYPGEPNNGVSGPEHCAAFPEHTATAWNDLSCNDAHPFICEL